MIDPSTDQYYDEHAWILVNGTNIRNLQGVKTELKEGDEVMIVSAAQGM